MCSQACGRCVHPAAKKPEVKVKPLLNLLSHTAITCKQSCTITRTHGAEKAYAIASLANATVSLKELSTIL